MKKARREVEMSVRVRWQHEAAGDVGVEPQSGLIAKLGHKLCYRAKAVVMALKQTAIQDDLLWL